MGEMFELAEEFLEGLANWSILLFEFVGILVLIVAGCIGVRDYITKNPKVRLILAEGMALSLEFKLGSEIIRTVIVREINELYFIGFLILIRATLTFIIHWEIRQEEIKEEREELKKNPEAIKQIREEEKINEETSFVERLLDKRFKK